MLIASNKLSKFQNCPEIEKSCSFFTGFHIKLKSKNVAEKDKKKFFWKKGVEHFHFWAFSRQILTCFCSSGLLQYKSFASLSPTVEVHGKSANELSSSTSNDPPPLQRKSTGLPPNMMGSGGAIYNNPEEMFPSAAKLFNSMRMVAAGAQMDMEKKK